ncbi:MAG: DNA-deoxyinosine glycosylase [Firmicutes bacterium]|nr:DNA-deoxyinosine glycosylase [Bacillota bacterium]
MLLAFPPIVGENSKVLILGSMPGKESLRKRQYYAFKRNQFWDIIYKLFEKEKDNDYESKKIFLLKHNIALWDVLINCKREGSLDSNIKNEVPNDFECFLDKYYNIKYIFFNGTKSQKLFKKHIGFNNKTIKDYYLLPSTSPAYTKKFEYKFEKWKIIKNKLIT